MGRVSWNQACAGLCCRDCCNALGVERLRHYTTNIQRPWSQRDSWDNKHFFSCNETMPSLALSKNSLAGAAQLDASGCPLEDGDIEQLLGRLPGLHVLLLSGCKKLTGAACKRVFGLGGSIPGSGSGSGSDAAEAAAAPQQQQRHRLRTVVMQRCFQLTAEALSDALLAGMQHSGGGSGRGGGAALEGVALSHLDLKQWPSEPVLAVLEARSRRSRGERAEGSAPKAAAAVTAAAVAAAAAATAPVGGEGMERPAVERPRGWPLPAPGIVAGLRALALHNCTGLTLGALQAVATSCPALEALFLGGSSLALQEAAGAAIAAAGGTGGGAEEGGGVGQQQQPLQLLPMGAAAGTGSIELAPGPVLPDAFMDCQGSMHSMQGVRRAAAAAIARLRLARLADPLIQSAAAELAAIAAMLPRLRVLEFTFVLPGLVPLLQSLSEEPGAWAALAGRHESAASPPPLVWDLCQPGSVRQALAWRRAVAAGNASGPSEVAVLLRAAANCSSGAKVTPLHVAAEEGRCSMAQVRRDWVWDWVHVAAAMLCVLMASQSWAWHEIFRTCNLDCSFVCSNLHCCAGVRCFGTIHSPFQDAC